jgi:hypothetical protein
MTDTALTKQQPAAIAPLDPMQMVQIAFQTAIERGEGLEVVDRILAQQREMMDYRDREAFNQALRRIQDKLKPIAKRGDNPETHSKYAKAEDIDAAIEDLLQEERMSLSFEPEAHPLPDMVRIVGVLSMGAYSKRYPLDMPADGKGAKGGGVMSRTHATGSAITYAKRYLKNMIFNLRFKEKDDDGNRAGGKQPGVLDEREHITHLENIRGANDGKELQRLYMAAQKAADACGDTKSTLAFANAKNKRYRELQEEGRI